MHPRRMRWTVIVLLLLFVSAALPVRAHAATVRLIVGLHTRFEPEGRLPSAQAIRTQRAAIAQAQAALLEKIAPFQPAVIQHYQFVPFVTLELNPAGLATLRSLPEVASAEEDTLDPLALAESTALIGAPAAWAQGYSGVGQTVAILDSGVDKTHPFLAGKVVAEACYSNANGHGAGTSLCPGGAAQSTAAGAAVPCAVRGCEHGTHVAGIAAGRGANFSGVARDATIIAIQVFTRFTSTCGATGSPCIASYASDQIAALEQVYALRESFSIAAVNLSLAGSVAASNCDSDARKAIIDTLRAAGIATVVAAGNDGSTTGIASPACISSAISVGSVKDGGADAKPRDQVSSFSNSAAFLSLLAPGEMITSAVPGGKWSALAGTSLAAPHVAGAWAVLKSRMPGAGVDQVFSALVESGVPISDPRNGITKPRIQLDAALQALLDLPAISLSDTRLMEGQDGLRDAVFTVTLSFASVAPVAVDYATVDETADSASDYLATSGTLLFPPGSTSRTIAVPVRGDLTDEPDETFAISLSAPRNGWIAGARAAATLVNDDSPPQIAIGSTRVTGSNLGITSALFVMQLSAPSGKPINVGYTVASATARVGGTVTFAPGTQSQLIHISIGNDSAASVLRVMLVSASNAAISPEQSQGIMIDNQPRAAPPLRHVYLPCVMRGA